MRVAPFGRPRVPLLGDGAIGRAVLAVEVEVAEQALPEGLAGLRDVLVTEHRWRVRHGMV